MFPSIPFDDVESTTSRKIEIHISGIRPPVINKPEVSWLIKKGQTTFKDVKIRSMVQAVNLPNILAYPTFKSDKLPPIYEKNLESVKRIEYLNVHHDKTCDKENGTFWQFLAAVMSVTICHKQRHVSDIFCY